MKQQIHGLMRWIWSITDADGLTNWHQDCDAGGLVGKWCIWMFR